MCGAVCHSVVEQVFSCAFEEAMRWCACALMEAGYCLLVHARLCSILRILPHRKCGKKRDETQLRVKHCIGFGSSRVVYGRGGGGKLGCGYIV